jgi:hypothetical protein
LHIEEKHDGLAGFRTRLVDKVVVSLAIEQAVLSTGKNALEQVGNKLHAKYGCSFSDCLEHPQYLKDVLEEMFGNSYKSVILSINNNLQESKDNMIISNFLAKVNK